MQGNGLGLPTEHLLHSSHEGPMFHPSSGQTSIARDKQERNVLQRTWLVWSASSRVGTRIIAATGAHHCCFSARLVQAGSGWGAQGRT